MKKTCRNCGNTECQQHTRCLMGWEPSGMPSRAAIIKLVKAIRHEAKDNGHWLMTETINALNAAENQMRIKK